MKGRNCRERKREIFLLLVHFQIGKTGWSSAGPKPRVQSLVPVLIYRNRAEGSPRFIMRELDWDSDWHPFGFWHHRQRLNTLYYGTARYQETFSNWVILSGTE